MISGKGVAQIEPHDENQRLERAVQRIRSSYFLRVIKLFMRFAMHGNAGAAASGMRVTFFNIKFLTFVKVVGANAWGLMQHTS